MELLTLPQNTANISKINQICGCVRMLFKEAHTSIVNNEPGRQIKQNLLFSSSVFLEKARRYVDVKWKVTVARQVVRFELGLDKSQTGVGLGLCAFLKDHGEEINQFTYQINNLRLENQTGLFYFLQNSGELVYQQKVYGVQYISTTAKIFKFLKHKMNQVLKTFLEQLETIIFYYKLPGFSLLQYQHSLQSNNHSVSLKRTSQKILILKQIFQRHRQQRRNLPINMRDQAHNKTVFEAIEFIQGRSYQYNPNRNNIIMLNNQAIYRIQLQFKQEIQFLHADLSRYQSQNFDRILTSINIQSKTKQSVIGLGGYSEIRSAIYCFVPQFSIDKTFNDLYPNKAITKTSCHLVKKSGPMKNINNSLQNEFSFLHYVRNKVCPYLAKYYCNNTIMPFSDGQVYLQYYPCSLGDSRLKQWQKMKVLEDICMGLLFLSTEGIIHRDLKQYNIMIDKNKRGRLIDFGSVSSYSGINKFKPIDDKVRSTEGYFIPYKEAVDLSPQLKNQLSKYEYYNHRSFDQYGLGKIVNNQFYLDFIVHQNHFLRHNLKYVSQKCQEPHPDDRLTIQEAIIFVRQLIYFNQFRRQFWHLGFNKKYSPHIFGELEGESELRIKQQQKNGLQFFALNQQP